jgi:hypothetical protein
MWRAVLAGNAEQTKAQEMEINSHFQSHRKDAPSGRYGRYCVASYLLELCGEIECRVILEAVYAMHKISGGVN